MYVCGMTPKFHPHVGHGRCYVAADMVRRTLEYLGYKVHHVQNFTDIDDKTILRAQEEGVTAADIAKKYTESYFDSMTQLGVLRATEYPTVTGYMDKIVEFIAALVDRGFGYVVDGDVWFEVSKFSGYGKLSKRTEEGGLVGVRKDLEPGKRDPRDFALWKSAKPGEPAWPSPWGEGRPGWHIECSTMVRETLGDQIDIHFGGQDLLFPHHENELAQSEALTGLEPFSRHWMHLGWVTNKSGEKMSHSLWNFVTLQDVLDKFDPAAVRLYLLQTHYRSPVAFSEEGLRATAKSLATLRFAYGETLGEVAASGLSWSGAAQDRFRTDAAPGRTWNGAAQALKDRFDAELEDDFNSVGAIGVLFETAHEVNRSAGPEQEGLRALFHLMVDVLGLPLGVRRETGSTEVGPLVELLIDLRAALRTEKQWELADRVRNGLKDLGIELQDSSEGTTWQRAD